MDRPCVGVHYPRSVGEFQAWFRTDADCLDYLEWLRWPNGFVCPHCGHAGGWWLVAERCPALPTRSDSIRGMARSPKRRKRAPDPPDLPTELDPAPARLESRARWECVHAGGDVEVGAQLAGVDIRESDWADADLAGRHLSGLHCRDVRFDRCDLSGAVLDAATLTRVLFTDCRLTGVVLNGATLQDVHVRGGRADMAYLRMAKANFLLVEDSPLREVDCYQATLAHTAFLGCDLRGANFQDCRLTDVDLHGSNLDGLRGALSLRGASIGIDQVLPLAPSLLADAGISVTPTARQRQS